MENHISSGHTEEAYLFGFDPRRGKTGVISKRDENAQLTIQEVTRKIIRSVTKPSKFPAKIRRPKMR